MLFGDIDQWKSVEVFGLDMTHGAWANANGLQSPLEQLPPLIF